MHNRSIIIALYLSIISSLIFADIGLADYPDGYYEVQRIIDGNTFELTDGKNVRLIGIDAPETGETCSTEATQRLSSLISGETVYLEKDVSETDIDGRLLRYVYVNGVFVNLELVSCGYCRYTCVAQQKKTTLIIAREWGQTLARECGQTMILD